MPEAPNYDTFLSHHHADASAVEVIARRLREEAKLEPFLDKWHLVPGASSQVELEQALARSATVAVFIGPAGLGPWHHEELRVALDRAVSTRNEYRVIPVLLPGGSKERLSGFLAGRTWVDFRAGLDSTEAFARLVAGIRGEAVSPGDYTLPDEPSPYRGLRRFEQRHARFFFGRQGDLERLLTKLRAKTFAAVVGASGSGKSSLVRAGLLPTLAEGTALPGSEEWTPLVLVPGAQPLRALATQLATLGPEERRVSLSDELTTRLEQRADGLRTAAQALLAERPRPLLLVVDQFEELFTQGKKEPREREAQTRGFIANLVDAMERGGKAFRVLLTLRADFLDRCLVHPPLKSLLEDGQILLGELDEPGLRDAIVRPAAEVGAFFEKGLVARMLEDVKDQRGALPLLQHALHELWLARRGPWLTEEAYEKSGGVKGALQQRAQASYDALSPEQQRLAHGLLVRLAELGEGVSDTRRRVGREELYPAGVAREQVDAVLESLSGEEARLIVADEKTVEVTHEALLQQWPTLRGWLRENRDELRTHRRLTEASLLWEGKRRDPSYLHSGARLVEAREWRDRHPGESNALERDFLDASEALADRRRREEEERQRKEVQAAQALARAEAARARQFRSGVGVVSALAVVGLILAVIAFFQARAADSRAQEALAFQLSAQAELLRNQQANLLSRSVLLGIESLQRVQSTETSLAVSKGLDLLRRIGSRVEHKSTVTSVAFSPDGKTLATASRDDTTRLSETSSGRQLALLEHGGPVYFVAFSLDGKTLATASRDDTARLWETSSGRQLARLAHGGSVSSVAFSPDGKTLATSSRDDTARLWEISSGRQLALLTHDGHVNSVAFSPDGKALATTSDDHTARLWETSSGRQLALLAHDAPVNSVAFSPDGKLLATASWDDTAHLWETSSGRQLALLAHDAPVNSVAFSPDGKTLATTSDAGTARLWETSPSRQLALLEHDNSVSSVAFSPDSKTLATTSLDNTAYLWEVSSGQQLARLAHDGSVNSVAFSPDGKTLATASDDGTARLWEMSSGRQLALLAHDAPVNSVAFSPNGRTLATASNDNTAYLWETSSGQQLALLAHNGAVNSVAFSPDGRTLATTSNNYTACLWETSSGQQLARLAHDGSVNSVAFSPDGKTLATGGDDTTARLWEVSSGRQLARLAHGGSVSSVAFSPDGKTLATGSDDGIASLWEVSSGRQLALLTHDRPINSVTFSPDGKILATASWANTTHLWAWLPKDLIDAACARLERNLTQEEWKQYLGEHEPYRKTCPNLP